MLGRAEQPYAPVHIAGTRDGSNDLMIAWVRRTRIGGELVDLTGAVPLGDASEAYEVDIRNAADTARATPAPPPPRTRTSTCGGTARRSARSASPQA